MMSVFELKGSMVPIVNGLCPSKTLPELSAVSVCDAVVAKALLNC